MILRSPSAPRVAALAAVLTAASACWFATPAIALDDLGVVSGDTFELPGYNDGPSGGGVWPGSSGSGGDVGAMPLPNGSPDTGGSPHGGPGGGGGSGTGESPKADAMRPPYLSPKSRNSPTSQLPFSVIRGGCSKPGALSSGVISLLAGIQSGPTVASSGSDEHPADELERRRAETAITANIHDFLVQSRLLVTTIGYANDYATGGELTQFQLERISRQYFATLLSWEVLYTNGIAPYTKNAFDCDHVAACQAFKSVRSRAVSTMLQIWRAAEVAVSVKGEIERTLTKFHFLPFAIRAQLDSLAHNLGMNPAASREAERKFQLHAIESWQDFFRREIERERR